MAIGLSSLLPAVRASASVISGDTVNVDVIAFNNTTHAAAYVVSPLDITFGTTQTYAGAGVNGQTVTVTSSEAIGATTTTDNILISVPTNFDVNSSAYSGLQFDVAIESGATDPINLASAINPATLVGSGFAVYGAGNTVFNETAVLTPINGNTALTGYEGLTSGSSSIYPYGVHEFSMSFTYANPVSATPEPGGLVLLGTGLTGMAGLIRHRARRA